MRLRRFLLLSAGLLGTAHAQWQLQQANTTADLHGVHALSDQIAWISGAQGTVLRTADGGSTWQRCSTPTGADQLDLRGVQAFDANTAIVLSSGKGDLSRLYKTTDACRTWTLVLTNPDPEGVWDSLKFHYNPGSGSQKGYFTGGVLIGRPVNGEFPIYTSKDYGNTWRSLQEDEEYSPGPSALANAGESLLAVNNTSLTTTTDDNTFAFVTGGNGGGRLVYPQGHREEYETVSVRYSFSDVHLPIASSATSGASSIAARRVSADRVDMMIVGGDSANPQVGTAVLVRRGGLRKLFAPSVTVSAHPPSGYRTAVAYDEVSNSWITVGPNGTDTSRDDGRTWTPLAPANSGESAQNWQALSLPFVVGPGGRVGKLHGIAPAAPASAPLTETASSTPEKASTRPGGLPTAGSSAQGSGEN